MSHPKVEFIGRIGVDPELKKTAGAQKSYCRLVVYTNENWTDKDGKKQESSQRNQVMVWGKRAEAVVKYCFKGRQVSITAKMRHRMYQNDEGEDTWVTELHASNIEFLGSSKAAAATAEGPDSEMPADFNDLNLDSGGDNTPF